MTGAKRKGTAWENTVKHHFQHKKCYVIRAAGSLGDYDLIAIEEGSWCVYGIQCKMDRGALDRKARERLRVLSLHYGIIPKLAYPAYGPDSKKLGNVIVEAV